MGFIQQDLGDEKRHCQKKTETSGSSRRMTSLMSENNDVGEDKKQQILGAKNGLSLIL